MSEPDYRAMWEELRKGVERLSSGTTDAALLYPEQKGRYDSRGEAYDIVLEEMTTIRGAHEHVAWAKAPDPAHTPAVRRVVAYVPASDNAYELLEDALRAENERLRETLGRIDGWASADMWRLASGPATTKADMRHQAMVISDEARHALGLEPRGDWTWRDVKRGTKR